MNGALTRLIGQAETSVADLARRTVESVTVPIRAKGQELVAETLDSVSRTVKGLVIRGVLGLVAAAMALVAIIYALSALYDALLPMLGPVYAKLTMAGAFALVAGIAIVAMILWPKGGAPAKAKAQAAVADARLASARTSAEASAAQIEAAKLRAAKVEAAAAAEDVARAEAAAEAQPTGDDLKTGFETIVTVLGEAGFRREQAGLRAGLALASQLKPMQIVSLALIGGFIAGLRYPGRS